MKTNCSSTEAICSSVGGTNTNLSTVSALSSQKSVNSVSPTLAGPIEVPVADWAVSTVFSAVLLRIHSRNSCVSSSPGFPEQWYEGPCSPISGKRVQDSHGAAGRYKSSRAEEGMRTAAPAPARIIAPRRGK